MQQMIRSKKFVATVAGVVAVLLAPDPEAAQGMLGALADNKMELVSLIAAYVVGQGLADQGKEAVRENRQAKK